MDLQDKISMGTALFGSSEIDRGASTALAEVASDAENGEVTVYMKDENGNEQKITIPCDGDLRAGDTATVIIQEGTATAISASGAGERSKKETAAAQETATTAQNTAEDAATKAKTAQTTAENADKKAQAAADDATSAKNTAETAASDALTAKDTATTAATTAQQASDDAKAAADKAEAEAQRAQDAEEKITANVDKVQSTADQAVSDIADEVTRAQTKEQEIETIANDTKTYAEGVQTALDAEVKRAQEKEQAASDAASSAQSSATQAAKDAQAAGVSASLAQSALEATVGTFERDEDGNIITDGKGNPVYKNKYFYHDDEGAHVISGDMTDPTRLDLTNDSLTISEGGAKLASFASDKIVLAKNKVNIGAIDIESGETSMLLATLDAKTAITPPEESSQIVAGAQITISATGKTASQTLTTELGRAQLYYDTDTQKNMRVTMLGDRQADLVTVEGKSLSIGKNPRVSSDPKSENINIIANTAISLNAQTVTINDKTPAYSTDITAEETARTSADNTLQNNIDAEETARKNADSDLQEQIDAIKFDPLTCYPVGSIYMSVNSTSPATLFGGTWTQLQNRFLVSAGSTYTAGSIGGSDAHSHRVNGHAHTISHTHSISSHTHTLEHTHTYGLRLGSYYNAFTSDVGSNQFSLYDGSHWVYSSTGSTDTASVPVISPVAAGTGTTSKNIYRPSLTINTSAASASTTSGTSLTTGAASSSNTGAASPTTNNANNLPPYLAVYMWKRTA